MACVGGIRFDDFGRRKLVARGSRYAPMPSAFFGEFNRIAVRIMSSHRALPGLFVRGFEKNTPLAFKCSYRASRLSVV